MSRVRGWCPSAHRPMVSGDGLLVRLAPPMARLSVDQMHDLSSLANAHGNGLIDLTSRGNLQIRGVAEGDYPGLLSGLIDAGLVPATPDADWSVTVTPFPDDAGETEALVAALAQAAPMLPVLPDKMGVVIDTGPTRLMADVSGDFRFERCQGGFLLRADGASLGRPVTLETAATAWLELADWFISSGGGTAGRMRRHLAETPLPEDWRQVAPITPSPPPGPSLAESRLGIAFGQFPASALLKICDLTNAYHVIFSPWRWLRLTDISGQSTDILVLETDISAEGAFLTDISDPLHRISACPGAPHCAQASFKTRALAQRLAPLLIDWPKATLHVSGCEKGCARQAVATATLIGGQNGIDLVEDGRARDTPAYRGLNEGELVAHLLRRKEEHGAGRQENGDEGGSEKERML